MQFVTFSVKTAVGTAPSRGVSASLVPTATSTNIEEESDYSYSDDDDWVDGTS